MRFSLLYPALVLVHCEVVAASDVQLPRTMDLSLVTDRSELSFEEGAAYFGILDHVQDVPADELSSASARLRRQRWQSSSQFSQRPEADFPVFVDLIEHPTAYRGQPVTLHGHLIRLVKSQAGPNEFGIKTLYEGWLVTENSQQHPATIICTELPLGMPFGEETINGVSVTGYFYKLRTYPSRDRKIRFAPLILAASLTWNPPQSPSGWGGSLLLLYGGLTVCTIAGLMYALLSARRNRRERDARFRETVPIEPPDFLESLNP